MDFIYNFLQAAKDKSNNSFKASMCQKDLQLQADWDDLIRHLKSSDRTLCFEYQFT